jgi:cyclophilin family peptidyl-prolyl cis-trans isomerase
VQFPQDKNPEEYHYFVVDLDAQHMPHAVFTFLTLVDRGRYNRSDDDQFAFHHNGAHIVFGSPSKEWQDVMLFQEYSEQMPHAQYSMGWTGLGPDLYFNVDNSEMHASRRDPCFGKVTHGWSVVERMHQSSGALEEEDWKEMETPVKIVSAVILR